MTLEEAYRRRLISKKEGIRARLHKYNPIKFPPIKFTYNLFEVIEYEMVILADKSKNIFNRDSTFYNMLRKNEKHKAKTKIR